MRRRPSNREMRKRIDEMVAMLGELLTLPKSSHGEVIELFVELGHEYGFRDLVNTMSQAATLPPEEQTQFIRELRGQLLAIKHDQFGG